MKEAKEMITPAYTLLYEEEIKYSKSKAMVIRHNKSDARD